MKIRIKSVISVFVCFLMVCLLLPADASAFYYGPNLNKTSVIIAKGESFTLKDTSGSGGSITWKSSRPSVATVNGKGKIKAKKTGRVTITAWLNGVEQSCTVTVKSSKKKAALENYRAFLEQDRISWGPDSDSRRSVAQKHCNFQLIYVDNDSVPELVVDLENLLDEYDELPRHCGYANMFSYKAGNLVFVGDGDRFQYYPKKGVFAEVEVYKGYKSKYYNKLSKGSAKYLFRSAVCLLDEQERKWYGYKSEFYCDSNNQTIKKETFKKMRKKAVGTTKRKDVDKNKAHLNTQENREKYLS